MAHFFLILLLFCWSCLNSCYILLSSCWMLILMLLNQDAEILCWDIRNLGCILCILKRNVTTNQRMYFDLNPDGSYIFSGNNDGKVTIWNTHLTLSEPEQILGPVNSFTAHDDCVNGIRYVSQDFYQIILHPCHSSLMFSYSLFKKQCSSISTFSCHMFWSEKIPWNDGFRWRWFWCDFRQEICCLWESC